MAQSTAGIKLYYGTSTDGSTVPASWTEIPDITGVPSMGAPPAKLDSTDLSATEYKTYINGLIDLGGALEFPANLTPELMTAVDTAAVVPSSPAARAFKVSFPSPVSTGYWWFGEIETVKPGESGVDAVLTTTLYISQESGLTKVDESEVS